MFTTPATPASTRPGLHRSFNAWMALVALVTVITAFGPSIVNASTRLAPLTPLVIVHSICFGSWLLLFLVQVILIGTRQIPVHRRLGIAGASLAALMVLVGVLASIQMARRGFDLSGDLGGVTANIPLLLAFQFGDLGVFAILVAAGLAFRNRPDIHKRLMLLATVSPYTLMGAPLAHLTGHWPQLQVVGAIASLLLLFSSAIHDRVSSGRIHRVSLWGGILLFVWNIVRVGFIVPSREWQDFVAWLVR
jgi:hypothetical protein